MLDKNTILFITCFILCCCCNKRAQKTHSCIDFRVNHERYDVNSNKIFKDLGWGIYPGVDTLSFKNRIYKCTIINNSIDTINLRIMDDVLFYSKAIGYKNGKEEVRDWDGWPMGYPVTIIPQHTFNCGLYFPFSNNEDSVFIQINVDKVRNGVESLEIIEFVVIENEMESLKPHMGICQD